ncbi:MAG: hypothetical protein IMX02_03365 [Limnochordaceae bacterium]|nr:hypothetical protein [Limnochordaceae bacterium]
MKPIDAADFPEFRYLPPAFVAAAAIMLVAALTRRRWLAGALVTASPALLLLLYDLYRWLYRYGHDLDPKAPIRIDPFMPPVIGWNRLANFTTLSYFNWGAVLFLVGMALVFYAWITSDPARQSRSASLTEHLHAPKAGATKP